MSYCFSLFSYIEEAVIKRTKKHVRRSTNENQDEISISTPHKYVKTIYIVDKYVVDFLELSTLTDILPIIANIVSLCCFISI